MSGPVQRQHHPPADHAPQPPIGLNPIPDLAQSRRQSAAAQGRVLSDEVLDELHFLGRDVLAAVTQQAFHAPQDTKRRLERKLEAALASTFLRRLRNPPPHGGGFPAGGIAIPEQQLQLVRVQAGGRLGAVLRPPLETALGKALLAQPESLAVINQNFQGSASAAGKDKQRPLQRFALELLAAKSGQTVD